MKNRRNSYQLLLLWGLFILAMGCSSNPSGLIDVTRFGARGDGVTLDTKAIQKALDRAGETGEKVIVPKGTYLMGTIYLRDNTIMELSPGATLLGSTDIADYDSLYWGHNQDRTPFHLVVVKGVKNVSIQGRGTIDGQGSAFWEYTEVQPRWMRKQLRRPSPMVEIDSCENVRITGLTLTNASGWTLHTFNCDQVVIDGIRLINNLYGPNNDGIDITGCNDVMVSNCYIKTCDDAICVKTTTDSRTSSNIAVTNCVMQTTCVALKCGETSKNITDLVFSNCIITKSSRALGIYATWGGDIENVSVSNIVCNTNAPLVLNRPIQISAWDRYSQDGVFELEGGNVRNVTISNFTASTQGRMLFTANHGKKVENIKLRDITLNYPYIEDPGEYALEATSNQFRGIEAQAMSARAAIVASNVDGFSIDGLVINWNQGSTIPEEWKLPERIENGKFDRVHRPDYDKVKMAEFHAIAAYNIKGGYVFAPGVKASDNTMVPIKIKNSQITIIPSKND